MIRALGRRLRSWRAGMEHRVAEDQRFYAVPHTIELRSDDFEPGAPMPPGRSSPALRWSGVPESARYLALVVEDVDVPLLRPVVHALAYAIDPSASSLERGALDGADDARGFMLGYNVAGGRRYVAPSPLPGHGTHHYVFTLLAVDYVPRFDQPPTRNRLLDAIGGHVVALGELIGTAER